MTYPKRLIVVLVILGLALGLVSYFILKRGTGRRLTPVPPDLTSLSLQGKVNAPLPVRLKIPKIDIDAAVEYVGLAPDGSVDVPKGPAEAAWFDLSALPGEIGNAVIDGHSGWKNGIPAVFDHLYKLEKGDKIYVEDSKGTIVTFVVRESRRYKPNTNPPEVYSSNDSASHLNLITCTGLWDKTEKTHSDRLVVFADKE